MTIEFRVRVRSGVTEGTRFCINTQVNYDSDGNGSNDASDTSQACVRTNCPPVTPCVGPLCPSSVGPGTPFGQVEGNGPSDQKPGSVLVYPIYTSSSTAPNRSNTSMSLTNTSTSSAAFVHLFFVNGANCSVSDRYVCLTANQTTTFFAADSDPDVTGFLVAVATDQNGWPLNFNHLIGDAYVKTVIGGSNFAGAYSAEAFAAVRDQDPNPAATTAAVNFNGVDYNLAPRVLAVSSILARPDGNFTWILVASLNGSLVTGPSSIGSIFGLLYDDAEDAVSWNVTAGCQWRVILSDDNPRMVPRFEIKIPSTRTGWMKFWATANLGIAGVVFNANANADGYNGGRTLHKLTLTTASYTIPVLPPFC